jgi:hypothetical protein
MAASPAPKAAIIAPITKKTTDDACFMACPYGAQFRNSGMTGKIAAGPRRASPTGVNADDVFQSIVLEPLKARILWFPQYMRAF